MSSPSQSTEVKVCSKCSETKPLEAFNRHRKAADGRQSDCKDCHRVASREWDIANRERRAELRLKRQLREPQKDKARRHLQWKIDSGQVKRPDTCERCGSNGKEYRDGRAGIQAHHPDYSKPLEVEWLCESCHKAKHAEEAVAHG
jgi:hypothetical protein